MNRTVTLDTHRQIIIANSIATALASNRAVPLLPTTVTRGEAVVAAGVALQFFSDRTSRKVDSATDTVLSSFRTKIDAGARVLRDDVVPLGIAQRERRDRYVFIQGQLFLNGTEYIRAPMLEQWGGMVTLRAAMLKPDVAAAIDAVGLRPEADHLLAHITLFGHVLGTEAGGAGAGLEEATGTWNRSMHMFIVQVELDYEHDQAIQQELLGAYEKQVELQRAGYRAKKAQAGEPAPAPPPAPAPGPEPAPAPDGSTPAAS